MLNSGRYARAMSEDNGPLMEHRDKKRRRESRSGTVRKQNLVRMEQGSRSLVPCPLARPKFGLQPPVEKIPAAAGGRVPERFLSSHAQPSVSITS